MGKTRDELQKLLDDLDAEMPSLVQSHRDEAHFWPAFSFKADEIHKQADGADFDWVFSCLDAMLLKHGIALPGDPVPLEQQDDLLHDARTI